MVVESLESAHLDGVLKKYFTNSFRKGYVTVDGITMPLRFKEMQREISDWEVDETDVWICSFPKTGTTWTQEMVWMMMNNLDFERGQVNLGARSPFFEVTALFDFRQLMTELRDFRPPAFIEDSLRFVKDQKGPRCIKTHLPFNLLPKQIQSGTKKPKMIYISRNPKDTCASYYHHCKLLEGYTGDFDDFYELFLAGKLTFAPYWSHVLPFWRRRHEDRVLFLTFEEMKRDLPAVIEKTAKFLDKRLSDKEVEALTTHLSFDNMKSNKSVNYELITEMNKRFKLIDYEGEFMRSGKIGGYTTLMTDEIVDKFDRWIEESSKNTDFKMYNRE